MGDYGQSVYIDPQQYQHQLHHHHEHQLHHSQQQPQPQTTKEQHKQHFIPTTTFQSITPDQFLGNDFDWITGMSELGTSSSIKTVNSHTATESVATPPVSSTSVMTPGHINANGDTFELFASLVSGPTTLSNGMFAGLDLLSLESTTSTSPHYEIDQDQAISSSKSIHPSGNSGSGKTDSARRRRHKIQKGPTLTKTSSSVLQSTATTTVMDPNTIAELSLSSAQPPTPMSPLSSLPDGRNAHHPWQRSSNLNMKHEMEHASGPYSPVAVASLTPTSASSSSPVNLFDLLPVTSTKPNSVLGQHQRVVSSTSQDARRKGEWAGHCATSMPSPTPNSLTCVRSPGDNNSNNSNCINSSGQTVSSLAVQTATLKKELSTEFGLSALAIESDAMNTDSSVHASPDPETNISSKSRASPDVDATGDLMINSMSEMCDDQDGRDSDADSNRAAACPHCGKEFQSKGLLRSHIVSHSSDRPFVCWDCNDKSYKRNHDLLRHRREKHNLDGAVVPTRGSGRSQGSIRESTTSRTTSQPTISTQSHVPHHELFYPTHGMIYLGNNSAMSDLSSSASGSPLDPYSGIEYTQHHSSQSLYHTQTSSAGLGLGMDLGVYGPKDFLNGLNAAAEGGTGRSGHGLGRGHGYANGQGHESGSGRCTSRTSRKGASSLASTVSGRKRKFSTSASTAPSLASPLAMAMVPQPPSTALGVTGPTSTSSLNVTPNIHTPVHHPQQLGTPLSAFDNLHGDIGYFSGGGI
ncbi:hypothetical protein BGZ98_008039 [Dissophora globulifera]|nr:hypothetical protein BGZ98_008039 [Dissophora globulifera]